MTRVLSAFRKPRTRPSRRFRRGVYLLPGLFTVANMFCGWASIVYAMRGEYGTAGPLIGFAMVLDMLDGRIARMTDSTSEFGEEFDSLADVISFGVAPATLVFAWGMEPLGRLGWAVAFLYVTATAMRLARFNIQGKSGDKRYFVGLPSPPAAGVLAATVFAYPVGLTGSGESLLALPVVLVPAALMVSRIRFRNIKTVIPEGRRSSLSLLVIAFVIAAIAVHPQSVLLAMAYVYLASGLVGLALARLKRHQVPVGSAAEPVNDERSAEPVEDERSAG